METKTPVNAELDIIKELKDFLSQLSDRFLALFDESNIKDDIDIVDEQEDTDGLVLYTQVGDSKEDLLVRCDIDGDAKDLDDENTTYDLSFKTKDGVSDIKYTDIKFEDVPDKIRDAAEQIFPGIVFASRKIEAKDPITCNRLVVSFNSNKDGVDVVAIKANYSPSLALVDLDTVLEDNSFIAELPEGESTYTIDSMPEEDLSVELIPESCELNTDDLYCGLDKILHDLSRISTIFFALKWKLSASYFVN